MLQQETALYLGPATVSRTAGRRVLVRRGGEPEAWADLALAFPYQPQPGDEVLLAAHEERRYVIGLLQGHGPVVLPFPGDVTLSAPAGTVRLIAGKGVSMEAPSIELRAGTIELEAKTLVQHLENAYQWVKDLFQVNAGRSRLDTEGSHHQVAERTYIRSEKETKIDGDRIYLG
jgi:hypothetical protein